MDRDAQDVAKGQGVANDNAPAVAPITWTASEVAAALGIARATFDRKRQELTKGGFPPPVPGLCGRWSILAVKHWVAGTPVASMTTIEVDIDQRRQELEDELA